MLLIKKYSNFAGIYKINNLITGCFYIGSAINIYQRTRIHLWYLRKGIHTNKHLQNSFNKYGEENFEFSIIEKLEDTKQLIDKEQFYIDLLKPKYNIRKIANSNLGLKMSIESNLKRSLSMSGRIQSSEHLKNRVLAITGVKKNCTNRIWKKGFKRTKESINKQINSNIKTIIKLDLYNNIIKEYKSIKEAKELTGKSTIWHYCNKVHKDPEGYIWDYKKNYLSLKLVDTVTLDTIKLNEVDKIICE